MNTLGREKNDVWNTRNGRVMSTAPRTYTPEFRLAIAKEVVAVMDAEEIQRETACRKVAKRHGMTRYQVRGICIVAERHGLIEIPTRPVHWFSTLELQRIGERMMQLRKEAYTVADACEIVAREIGCRPSTVERRWHQGLRAGRWSDPVTSRAEVEAR